VADHAVHPEFRRAVRIGEDALAKRALAILTAPRLRPGQEEALVAGQAVDHRRLTVLGDVAALGGIGHFEPAKVADILAHGECAADVDAG
jgi:hypothetical protein